MSATAAINISVTAKIVICIRLSPIVDKKALIISILNTYYKQYLFVSIVIQNGLDMKITTFSDCALRILIFLAVNDDEVTSAREIATRYAISFHHVAKAAQWLVRHGYVSATRGKGGGLKLASAPEDISIGDVIRRAEAGTGLVECMREKGRYCVIESSCGLAAILGEAHGAFFDTLDRYSLADATAKRGAIAHLLS